MLHKEFLPVNREEYLKAGVKQLDFICITGDAYVDHPSYGVAIISRVLKAKGYNVGIIAQPNINKESDFLRLGIPKYAFLVTSGNLDSMVLHYSVAKNKRKKDLYTAGGVAGKRPDRAVIRYSNMLKKIASDTPVLIGGLEASLRRFAHYDYWDDRVMPSILIDSKADLLMYGMGELAVMEIAKRFSTGEKVSDMHDINGTCYLCQPIDTPYGSVECPNFDIVSTDKKSYAKSALLQQNEQDELVGKTVIQRHGKQMLVQNPPMRILTTEEMDWVYSLPFTRTYHPMYEKLGGVPALEEVEFSVAHNRGCFGACNFCSLAFHQGRRIAVRSKESILEEARSFVENKSFKGYVHDVGGPTANFRHNSCDKQNKHGMCKHRKCLAPKACEALKVNHEEYLDILREMRKIKGIKKVFVRSGVRYDYALHDKNDNFLRELIEHHVSGQLKVAPEHCCDKVLDKMGKPHIADYKKFAQKFYQTTKKIGKEQYLVPYLMSSHPGSDINEAIELALFLKKENIHPEQVQDFYPTPGTISTAMYYTELDPYSMQKIFVAKSSQEKAMQRALLQYFDPKNKELVLRALKRAKRFDLIGKGANALVNEDMVKNNRNRNDKKREFPKKQIISKGRRNAKKKR